MACVRTSSPLLQFISYVLRCILFVQVRGDVVRFALPERVQLFTSLLTRFRVSGGYIDGGAVPDEAFADHAADAFRAACDEYDFALGRVR
jgi:hypothetical protein